MQSRIFVKKNYFLRPFPQNTQKLITRWTLDKYLQVVGCKDVSKLLANQPKEIENDLIDFICPFVMPGLTLISLWVILEKRCDTGILCLSTILSQIDKKAFHKTHQRYYSVFLQDRFHRFVRSLIP